MSRPPGDADVPDDRIGGPLDAGSTRPGPPAAALVLAAAAEVVAVGDPHRWRDLAVERAVGLAWRSGDLVAVGQLAAGYDELLLVAPTNDGDGPVLRPIGNAERRHRGAFSTPPAYAAALADRALTPWVQRFAAGAGGGGGGGPTVVDPACGAGALLRAVLARLLAAGVPPGAAADALHGVDADPVAVLLCRAALAADLTLAGYGCAPDDLAARIVTGDALLGATPAQPAAGAGITWHELFPAVLDQSGAAGEPVTGWRGGFDAVVANPPWERLKVHARDWDGEPPAGLRAGRAGMARSLRAAGRHPLTGTGELNAYLPFVETCWRLLGPDGRAALLVPAGIASDRSAARLIEALAGSGSLARLHLIEPGAPIFAGVSGRITVAVVELAGGPPRAALPPGPESGPRPPAQGRPPGPATSRPPAQGRPPGPATSRPPAQVAVGLSGPTDPPGDRSWTLTADLLRVVNPNTGTSPLFVSAQDARIATAVHRRTPVLLRRDPDSRAIVDDAWQLRLVTPLHMTKDARYFRDAPGEGLLPLWEAKHCALLDPRGGSARHRYWVPADLVLERFGSLCERGWLAGYRNVSTTSGARTLLPTPLPVAGVGNSLPMVSAGRLPLLLAALASLPVDYLLRQKHAGANVNFFKLEQVPVPRPADYDVPSPWSEGTIGDFVLERFAHAVHWSEGLEGLAAELERDGGPPPPLEHHRPAQRAQALAELDAVHAHMFGLTRTELRHVLDTFTALRMGDEKRHGRFVTAERVLAAYDRLEH